VEEPDDVTAGLPDVESSLDTSYVGTIVPAASDTVLSGDWGQSADSDAVYACSMTLDQDALANLSMVEGLLYLDLSDDEDTYFVELGSMQNAGINWQTGEIVSQFDGSWPMLDEQLVVLYDQLVNGGIRRSIIPVRRNGEEGYLLVSRNEAQGEWVVVGFSIGYDENGLPARGSQRLEPGDEIIPTYPMLYLDTDGEMQDASFDGDPIIVDEDGNISFEFNIILMCIYILKTIGIANMVRHGLSLSTPGFHFGITDTTLTASLSKEASTPRTTLILLTLPSFSTTN